MEGPTGFQLGRTRLRHGGDPDAAGAQRGWAPGVLLLTSPWQWFGDLFASIARFITSEEVRTFGANTSLLMIVGGLSILFLIVTLFLLQSVFPTAIAPLASAKGRRQIRPTVAPEGQVPTVLGSGKDRKSRLSRREDPTPVHAIDAALDRIVEAGVGQPRIVRHLPRFLYIRMLSCRGCRPPAEGAEPLEERIKGCAYERGFLETAFQAAFRGPLAVRETACRRMGAKDCEFEVRH